MQVPGTLVVVGDFNRAITVNVSRRKLTDYDLQPDSSPEAMADAIIADIKRQPGLFSFETLSSSFRNGGDGRPYFDLEFRLETCRGEIVEGLKGRLRCVTLGDVTVPTVPKHIFQSATIADGYVYLAVGGTVDAQWNEASSELLAAARSFILPRAA